MGSLFKKLMRDHFMEAIAKGLIGPLSMMLMRPFGKSLMGSIFYEITCEQAHGIAC
jgi:hypothetical protein